MLSDPSLLHGEGQQLEVSAGDAQLGPASSGYPRVNLCLCASPDRLGKPRIENLRTAPELAPMAPRQLPSTGCPEQRRRGSETSFTLMGRFSTSEGEEEGPFAPVLPFPAHLLHQLSLLFLVHLPSYTQQCFDFPPASSLYLAQLQAATQKDDTSERHPDT